MDMITVMAGRPDGQVVLWEVNEAHPGGEAWITGDGRSVQVALTAAVQRKLDSGELIRVGSAPSTSSGDATETPPEPVGEPVEGVEAPWDGYDALSASAIVARLGELTDAEREAVRVYEAAHKNRKTVLEAL